MSSVRLIIYIQFVYPCNLGIFWPAFTLMKTSKEKLLREKMGKYVIKLLGLNLKKERKLYERF